VAEQRAADGPGEERDAEGQKRVERLRLLRGFRKERFPDHQRDGRFSVLLSQVREKVASAACGDRHSGRANTLLKGKSTDGSARAPFTLSYRGA
jgi:hypothetical protein